MRDTIPESFKIPVAVSDSFKDFDFIVAAFGKTVGNRSRERIEYTYYPVNHCLSRFFKSINATNKRGIKPIKTHRLRRWVFIGFNFFDVQVLQSDKFFCKISVEHISDLRFWFIVNSILTDLVQICSTFFIFFLVGSISYPNFYYRAKFL